ncbi:MAG: hypothetical protein IJH39_02605 [Clostridia bacterium]|nr:hypothetical protein [Clostridia bacterium]
MEKNAKNNKKQILSLIMGILTLIILLVILANVIVKNATGKTILQTIVYAIQDYKKENEKENEDYKGVYCEGEEGFMASKPIVYLYPTQTTEVEVKLGNPEKLSCTYPQYEDSWKIIANPNGNLKDIETGRNLYALYWEGKEFSKNTNMEEGFCVKGEDTARFLEEKLEILGLTPREAEEFIIYWLPKMENNKYNYIRFETIEEQNSAMPLEITPKPDSVIRIMMDWKSLNEKIEVKEQELQKTERTGFVAVEWGGSELVE